jgi:phage terminase Nu1 subunit (DNA packaging protein)
MRTQFTDSTQEVESIKATITKLRFQIAKLEGVGTGTIPSVGSIPGLGQEQMRLLREFKIQATLVELLTKQNELAKLNEEKNINSIQVIQRAQEPDKKVKPKRVKMVLLTTFFAFALSIAAIIARQHYDNIPSETRQRLTDIVRLVSPWLASRM